MLPDDELEGRTYVLALFDNDPAADVDHLQKLPEAERRRITQVGPGRQILDVPFTLRRWGLIDAEFAEGTVLRGPQAPGPFASGGWLVGQ